MAGECWWPSTLSWWPDVSVLSKLIAGSARSSVATVASVAVAKATPEVATPDERERTQGVATVATVATDTLKLPFATATLATLATVDALKLPFATATVATVATLSRETDSATATFATVATVDGYPWEERAAIAEYDGGLSRADAELLASAAHPPPPPPPVSSCLPGAGLVRCADCRHAVAAPYDEPGAWRLCRVGGRSGWSMQERHCQKWEVHH